ncbi:hypothetical protein KIH81_00420 [Bifidobacterium sp. 82T25]|nr:hypothetical protein [Bifidobacterium miconisargentati]
MSFVIPEHWKTRKAEDMGNDEPVPGTSTAVQLPATGINAYESGFGIRTGWAGRSK